MIDPKSLKPEDVGRKVWVRKDTITVEGKINEFGDSWLSVLFGDPCDPNSIPVVQLQDPRDCNFALDHKNFVVIECESPLEIHMINDPTSTATGECARLIIEHFDENAQDYV